MSLNIVLDTDVVLELLSLHQNDTQHCFTRLQKSTLHFWIPCCTLATLESQIFATQHHPINNLLNGSVQLLSSIGSHWQQIPTTCPNKTQGLISLDASALPSKTIIWTNAETFISLDEAIEWGDHEFIYGILAEYEYSEELAIASQDLAAQQLLLRSDLETQLFNVLKEGQYHAGMNIHHLEEQLSTALAAPHCVSVASGSEALLLALLACQVQAGDDVIMPALAPPEIAQLLLLIGVNPTFVDIDPNTYTLSPVILASALTPQTRAIIAVNVFGQCADYASLNDFTQQHGLPLIEYAGDSFGARYQNQASGTLATIGCLNFAPHKPLGTYGSGGACITRDDQYADKLYELRSRRLDSTLDTLQASILLTKLTIFQQEIEARQTLAQLYTRLLEETVNTNILEEKVKTPFISADCTSVFTQYPIEVDERDKVLADLQAQGIPVTAPYPSPLPLQPAYAHMNYEAGDFRMADIASQRILTLPLHPYLSEEKVQATVSAVRQCVNH